MALRLGELSQWAQELNDADDETVRLILQLHIDDFAAVDIAIGTQTTEALQDDQVLAHDLALRELQEYAESRNIELPPAREPSPPPPATYKCIICEDHYRTDRCHQVPCEHRYCEDCLNTLFRNAMNDDRFYPPRCCRQTVPLEDVRTFLDPGLLAQFEAVKPEKDDPNKAYCHKQTCSAYIPAKTRIDNTGICFKCNSLTCLLCKQVRHDGDCKKDEAEEQVKALATSEGWQTCPGCARLVELNTGCNHMTCRCKAEFCYVCGKTWKTCDCPQFDLARIYERAQVIQDREGGDIDDIANAVEANHACVDHDWARQYGEFDCETCQQTLTRYIFRCNNCMEQICWRCRFNS